MRIEINLHRVAIELLSHPRPFHIETEADVKYDLTVKHDQTWAVLTAEQLHDLAAVFRTLAEVATLDTEHERP